MFSLAQAPSSSEIVSSIEPGDCHLSLLVGLSLGPSLEVMDTCVTAPGSAMGFGD